MKIISFSQARAQGLKRYFTGKPCSNGHICERDSSKGMCIECERERSRIKSLGAYQRNKAKNPEKLKAWYADRYQREKELRKQRARDNYYKNHKVYNARASLRNKELRKRTLDRESVIKFYEERPEGMEVDHIIPINHPLVCGLHCVANFQYLSPEDNRKKSNSFDQDTASRLPN